MNVFVCFVVHASNGKNRTKHFLLLRSPSDDCHPKYPFHSADPKAAIGDWFAWYRPVAGGYLMTGGITTNSYKRVVENQ